MNRKPPKVFIDETPQRCVLSQSDWHDDKEVELIISDPKDALLVIASLVKYLKIQYPSILKFVMKEG